ncbi:MAG: hypothetical protein ACK5L5_10470 [Bacteroidales bacterium]
MRFQNRPSQFIFPENQDGLTQEEHLFAERYCKVMVLDARKQEITLREVQTAPDEDYYLEITSPSKAMTEASMNRQLKADLNLRPIYHQKDERSDAHLFLGLLSYWIVNTIRFQIKQSGDNAYWTEIVRRMSTQKLVTTEAINALGEKVELRQCSKPTKQVE